MCVYGSLLQALEKLNKAQEDQANAADVKLQAQQKEALVMLQI